MFPNKRRGNSTHFKEIKVSNKMVAGGAADDRYKGRMQENSKREKRTKLRKRLMLKRGVLQAGGEA